MVAEPRRGTTLGRCLVLAQNNHPNIWAARARLKVMRAQLSEAHTAPFSQFSANAAIGPAPTFRGNSVYSPNTDILTSTSLGPAWRFGVEGMVPIWTFGKISNLWEAAEAQIEVGEGDIAKQKALVRMDVRRAFYGLQASRDSLRLVNEVIEKLDSALRHLDEQVAAGNADPTDAFKLKTLRYELEGRRAEAGRYERIALSSLRFLTGGDADFDIPRETLRVTKRPLGPVASYLAAARLFRPEVNMLKAGIAARKAQVALQKSKYFPDIGLGVFWNYARAVEVNDQLNPFIRDDANYTHFGGVFGLRWQLDPLANEARVRQAEGQLEELRQSERYALGGIGVEVETAYAQVADAQTREEAYGMGERMARQWVIAVQQGIDIGTKEEADLVDGARQLAMQRFYHLTAIMDLNVAWASLALATGWDDIAPREE